MKNKELTQSFLKSVLNYSPENGVLTWKNPTGDGVKIGWVAGCVAKMKNGKKYLKVGINGKSYYAHRVIWVYMTGEYPEKQVDHEDGNGLNNKWLNLKKATNTSNHRNRRLPSDNVSGCIGVAYNKNRHRWQASISTVYLGSFDNIFEAACIRKAAEISNNYHPNHGNKRPL
jgi:hypothetical protein